MDVSETLKQRDALYGDYTEQANIACALKAEMAKGRNWATLAPYQREALDIIQVKISRILNGDQNCHDSWHDIEGYAKLVADRLEK